MGVRLNTAWRGILVRWKLIVAAVFTLYGLHLVQDHFHFFNYHAHVVTELTASYASTASPQDPLPPASADTFCRAHKFAPYPSSHKRKIYDLFLFNTELDWLEIRLNTLASSVDYFVIVESPHTFTAQPKPLILKENWSRFEKFHGQIIYHVLNNPLENPKSTWETEIFQRNSMFTQVFPYLKHEQKPGVGDIIVVSDVDEIPKPASLGLLRNCDVPRRVTLRSEFYYYSFQWLHQGQQWAHGQATIFGGLKKGETILPHDLRGARGDWNWLKIWWEQTDIWNAGWHCSTCFKNIEQVLNKMASFSHVELNQDKFRDKAHIIDRIRNGKDLWDRWGQYYSRVEANEDIPEYLTKDRKRWEYLLDRDGENAGFQDVK